MLKEQAAIRHNANQPARSVIVKSSRNFVLQALWIEWVEPDTEELGQSVTHPPVT